MKFNQMKEFKPRIGQKLEDIANYLAKELAISLRELQNGLSKLKFEDNFVCFKVEVTIAATS